MGDSAKSIKLGSERSWKVLDERSPLLWALA